MTIREIVSIYDYLLSLPMDYKHSHPIYKLLASLEDELRIKVNEVKEIVVDDFALLIKKNWLLNFDDEKFAWSLYMLYIKKRPGDRDAYRKISYFLMMNGWKLEYEALNDFINKDYNYKVLYLYFANLKLYKTNGINEMNEEEIDEYIKSIINIANDS